MASYRVISILLLYTLYWYQLISGPDEEEEEEELSGEEGEEGEDVDLEDS